MIQRFEAFVTGITACYKYIQKIKSAEMTEFGLKGTHVMCMFYLHHHEEGLTAAQLSTLCAEDKAAISRTVGELETKGYLEVQQETGKKKYRAILHLSQTGVQIAEQIDVLIQRWVGVGGDGLTEEERRIFYQSLASIGNQLREHLEE